LEIKITAQHSVGDAMPLHEHAAGRSAAAQEIKL